MTNARQPDTPGEDLPDWLRPPQRPSHRRALIIVAALTMMLLVSGLLVVLLNGGDDQPAPALTATPSSPASSPRITPVTTTGEPPGSSRHRPGGRDEARTAAQAVISGFNDRDTEALRASSCERSSITDDFFDDVPESVRFSLDKEMTLTGPSATVGYRITSQSGSVTHDGSMHLMWNGARWCLDYAT